MITTSQKILSAVIASGLTALHLLLSFTVFGLVKLDPKEFIVRLAWHAILVVSVMFALVITSPLLYWITTKLNLSAPFLRFLFFPILTIFLVDFIVLIWVGASGTAWVPSVVILNTLIIKVVIARNDGAWNVNNYQ